MSIKKSKITKCTFKREYVSPEKAEIYYHDLELENGDYGSIGTKTKEPEKIAVGAELTYSITENGEYQGKKQYKIKAEQDQNKQSFGGGGKSNFNLEFETKKLELETKKQKAIIAQSSFGYALEFYENKVGLRKEEIFDLANEIYNEVIKKSGL